MVGAGNSSAGESCPILASHSPADVRSPSSFPRSFSHGTEDGLEAGTSPNNTFLGSRINSRDSPLENRRNSVSRRRHILRNAYFEADDLGIYLSSVAVNVLLAIITFIGIILLTLVVTLALELGNCSKKPLPSFCASFLLNAEMNNLQGYQLPQGCEHFVAWYVDSGQYHSDVSVAVEAARQYLMAFKANEHDLVILDVDETSLSNMPYYVAHKYGVKGWDERSWETWVHNASAPALDPVLSLYTDLRAQNWSVGFITGRPQAQGTDTAENLKNAGYTGWATLILRTPEEESLTAAEYKSKYRKMLSMEGYRIRSLVGDQWSDLTGGYAGERTYKLPNPMYYIY